MKFESKFHDFLFNLCSDFPAYYDDIQNNYAPMLEDPADPKERGRIAFYLLFNGGYLTRGDEGKTHFKIPNNEVRTDFIIDMRNYIDNLPLEKKSISKLHEATKSEDFHAFGVEITKSLYKLYLSRKAGDSHPKERAIHDLMLTYLEDLRANGDYKVLHEHGAGYPSDGSEKGYRMDFHLEPNRVESKTHYIIELKKHDTDDESIVVKALEGLKQIYEFNYHRHLLESNDTKAVIMMGLAAHYDHICLVTQKVDVKNGKILEAEAISQQRFRIADNCKDKTQIEFIEQEKYDLKQIIFDEKTKLEMDNELKDKSLNIEFN
jgi:hypothetical protein